MVDLMVGKLFGGRAPTAEASLLDPGCGGGEFIEGVVRACQAQGWPLPRIVGVELDPDRATAARRQFQHLPQVEIRQADFLQPSLERFDFIIGNPPYVSILELSDAERLQYRHAYQTASGRFDLYSLFFEQALRMLAPAGRLVFITPEKFLYVETARPLRELLALHRLEELHFASEDTFADRVTYPLITTLTAGGDPALTRIVRRDGTTTAAMLTNPGSWLPQVEGFAASPENSGTTLADICVRISAGVATGADGVFVLPTDAVPPELRRYAHPTISGRQITPTGVMVLRSALLAPYDASGRLLPEHRLGALGSFLAQPDRRGRLERRTCTAYKPWYAFHDNLPLPDMLRPKLLCKDITEEPFFVLDSAGSLVPRHSVYYVVPAAESDLVPLAEYLNSEPARAWLRAHCQRAANGFFRMQSHVLKQLPVPGYFQRIGDVRREAALQQHLPDDHARQDQKRRHWGRESLRTSNGTSATAIHG